MDTKQKFQNDPAKFFLYQDRLLTHEERQRASEYSAQILNLKTCPICDCDYNLSANAPRILIHCGHTVCTACLYLFFKDQRIRCPLCSKIIKRLRFIEILPLNHQIFNMLNGHIPSDQIDPLNSALKLPSEMTEELAEKEEYEYPLCEVHTDRYKHFICMHHNALLCRACITEELHCCEYNIVDLYSLQHDTVKTILEKLFQMMPMHEMPQTDDS